MSSPGKTGSGNPASAVHIRPMSAGDLDRVLSIAEGLPHAPCWTAAAYLEAIDPDHRPPRVALVAAAALADAQSDSPIGFVIASLVAPDAELETIAVAAGGQRRRVGSLLLASLMDELRRALATALRLEVRASNHAALGFYQAQGFRETGRRPRYYADPQEDAVLMERPVGQEVGWPGV